MYNKVTASSVYLDPQHYPQFEHGNNVPTSNFHAVTLDATTRHTINFHAQDRLGLRFGDGCRHGNNDTALHVFLNTQHVFVQAHYAVSART